MPQISRSQFRKTLCKIVRGLAGHTQRGDMCDPLELFPNGGIQFDMPVSVHIAPETGNPIEEFLAVSGGEPTPFTPVDDQ